MDDLRPAAPARRRRAKAGMEPVAAASALSADRLGLRRIAMQTKHDLFGTKDVQDVATASYVWLADQIGHVTLGLFPTLLLCWLWLHLAAWHGTTGKIVIAGYFICGFGVLYFWYRKEQSDKAEARTRAGRGTFGFDSADIDWNVATTLVYFGIGAALAVAAFISPYLLLAAFLFALWPALTVGVWWLKRKLAFQQSGSPYLYRLANFSTAFTSGGHDERTSICHLANAVNRRVSLWRVLCNRVRLRKPPMPAHCHLLVTGPFRCGKSSLAVGITTEFAFALGAGRYLSPVDLIENLATDANPAKPLEYYDGRVLWKTRECELIVVDNLDSAVVTRGGAGAAGPPRLVRPEEFSALLKAAAGEEKPLSWLATKRSVWVIGDGASAAQWRAALAALIGILPDAMAVVELADRPARRPG